MKLCNEAASGPGRAKGPSPLGPPAVPGLHQEGKHGRHPRGGKVCEYCGCQALAPIAELTREHDLALSLVCEARIARDKGNVSRMAELASQIAAALGPHTQ